MSCFDLKQVKSTPPPINLDLRDQLIGVGFGDRLAEDRITNWAIGKDGLYLVKSSEIGRVVVKVATSSLSIPAAPEMKPIFNPALPLIPFSVFSPAITFLRDVKATKKTEGLVRFYFHEGVWSAHVPEQTVGTAEVEVKEGLAQPPGLFAAEIHSHPGTSATPSGVDDANEQIDRMFMIVAFPPNAQPTFTARVGTGVKLWLACIMADFIDVEEGIVWKKPIPAKQFFGTADTFPYMEYPDEWMEKIQERPPQVVVIGDHVHSRFNPHGWFNRGDADHPGGPSGYTGQLNGTKYINGVPQSALIETGRTRKLTKAEKKALKKRDQDHEEDLAQWLRERALEGTLSGYEID